MTHASRTKLILFAALTGAAALTLGLMARSGVTPAIAGGCANANAGPGDVSPKAYAKAVTCLINQERTNRGKDAAGGNAKLRAVAADHADVMVDQKCFEHACPGEGSIEKRLKAVGYLHGKWAFGENIGYESTPNNMIDRWMESPEHRQHLLKGKFDDIGVGAADGSPVNQVPDEDATTWTVILAFTG